MANQKITVEVDVQSNTAKETTQAERLGAALKDAAASAQKIKIPAGGATGVGAVMQKSQPVGAQAVMQYGQQRGAAGATGAEARDFAAQSQGLGGLVRLYATYAANIYAAGAAFRALSEAMNTANMVKGLDTLGAASGRNLGTLSKRLVEVSDGALSFRDAMEAVATTSAAGMTAKETEALTQVAKNASIALGKSMPDSLSRLSRAVTKLEPELLDELGIMTKIEPAVDAYALKLGKASSQLTQAQRQQAFLNAVVKEGTEKFGDLNDIAANPFDKLSASLKNTLQGGLEFLNKFIAPVVDLLAQSPTALVTAIAAVGFALVKQALPALGEFKAGLAASANKATELAKQKRDEATAAQAKVNQIITDQVEARANKEIEAVNAAEKRILELRQSNLSKQSVAYKILQKDIDDVTAKDLARLERAAKRFDDKGLKEQAAAYREVGRSIEASQKAEEDLIRAKLKARQDAEREQKSLFSTVGIRQSLATKATDSETKKQIVSDAALNASLVGLSGSWKLLNADIDASNLKLNSFTRSLLVARGALGIFIGLASTAGAVLSGFLGWIGLIVSAVGLLDTVFSNNSKESQSFSTALDRTKDAAEGAARTIELIDKKGITFAQSIEGVYALSNALQGVADSTDGLTEAAKKAKSTFSTWEDLKDKVASLFGGGVEKNLNKSLADSVSNAFQLLSKSGLENEAREAFGKILNIDTFDTKSIEEAFSKLSVEGKQQAEAALVRQAATLKDSSDRLQSFKGAAEASKKAYDEFIQSTANTNPLFKVGSALQTLAAEMQVLKRNGVNELGAAFDLFAKKPEFAALFGKAFVDNLIVVRQEFIKNRDALALTDAQIVQAKKDVELYQKQLEALPNTPARATSMAALNLQAAKDQLQSAETKRVLQVEVNEKSIKQGSALLNSGITGAFQESARILDVALGQSAAKAALTIAKTRAAGLYGVEKARVEGDLAKRELEVQLKAVDLNIDMILSQERLVFALQASQAATNAQAEATKVQTLQLKASELQDKAKALPEGSTEKLTAQKNVEIANKAVSDAETRQKNLQAIAEGLGAVSVSLNEATRVTMGKGGKGIGLSEKQLGALSSDEARSQARLAIMPVQNKIAAQVASGTEIKGAITAREEQTDMNVRAAQVEQTKKILSLEAAIGTTKENNLNITTAIAGATSREIIDLQQAQALEQLKSAQKIARLDKERELDEALINIRKNSGGQESANALKRELAAMSEKDIQEQVNLLIDFKNKKTTNEIDLIGKRLDLAKEQAEIDSTRNKAALDYQVAQLAGYSELYSYSKKFNIQQQELLDKKRIELEYTDKTGIATLEIEAKRAAAQEKIKSIIGNANEVEGLSVAEIATINAIKTQIAQEEDLYNKQKTRADEQKASQLAILDLTTRTNLEQERYNKALEKANELSQSFSNVFAGIAEAGISAFEKMGQGIGNVVTSFTEMRIQNEKNAKTQEDLNKRIKSMAEDPEADPKKYNALIEERNELQKKSQKDELTGMAKSIGAAKSMFKEKSGAYKALAAIEKAMHIGKLVMEAKEFAVKNGFLTAGVAAKAGAETAETAVTEAGFLARAGTYVTEIFSKFTAMLGPWGMAAAAAAIAAIGLSSMGGGKPKNFIPSAEQRQETQGTAMGWDMTQAYGSEGKKIQVREGVFGDTSAKSESIANSLEVIKNNSVAGLSYNDSMLKALEDLNKTMANAAKAIYGLKGITSGTGFGNKEFTKSKGGFLGIGGKDVSQEITDSGVKLQGTFLELAQKGGGVIQQFETLTTTTKKKGFLGIGGSTRIDVSTKFKDLDPKAAESINGAFNKGYTTIMTAAAESGIKELTPARVNEILSGVKVDEIASLRGLKGEELQTQLNAVVGSVLDDAAGATFTQFKQFREFGEGMFETAVRVIDTNKKVKQVLSNLSGSVQNISFDISEQMVQMAGGLEAFIEQSDSFSENFLTEEERLAPKKKAVREELNRLGLSWVTTRKQFKDVVQSLIDSGAAGSETYADLMKLNKGFAEVTPEVENLSKSLSELKNDLKSAAEQRISDLKSARDGFEQFSKSIRDYQQSLKTGALSPLTPGEKYIENKRQFEQLSALAKTDTKEGADARSKLQGAASALLESSRTMYSSSETYTQDFGSVQAALDSAAQYGDEQVKKANESIDLVKQQVQGLVDLKDSVDRLPEPISAGVGAAVMAALAGVTAAQNPVEAVKAAEAAKAERDERAIAYAQESSSILKQILNETAQSAVKDANRNIFGLPIGTKNTTATAASVSSPAAESSYDWSWMSMTQGAATGSNYIPKDMHLFVHKGERIMPAADNKQLMKMVNEYSSGGGNNAAVYEEICKLTKQVEVLTQVVADGANMNTQATERNTVELAKTLEDMSKTAAYGDRLINRTTVV